VAWPSTFLFGDAPDATRGAPSGPPTRAASIPGLEATHTWFATTNGFLSASPLATLNYRWNTSGSRRQPLPSTLSASPGRVAVGAVSIMRSGYSGSEGLMIVEYNPLYSTVEEIPWLYFGRVTQFEIVDEQTVGPDAIYPHVRSFVLAVRQHDPRYYRWNPADGGGFVGVGSLPVDGSAQTLTNEGTAPADPVFEITSPGASVTIFNATTGKTLALAGLPSLAGSVLTVDFGLRVAYKDFFALDLTGYVNLASTNAWDFGAAGLVPGVNAVGIATGSGSWAAKWRGAYW
jgi:hypothetical protein